MKIIRAEKSDIDVFSESELDFGACCFFGEDKTCKYFFEIKKREATLHANTDRHISQAIEEFLFYSGFITAVKDKDGRVLATRTPSEPYPLEITEIQPSQFYINEKKLADCKKWMNEPRRKQRGIVRSPVELHSGFNTFLTAPRGGVLNPSARIKSPEDIFIPITTKDGKIISLDGHTRMRAAIDLGYTSVFVYQDEHDEHVFHFSNEAINRQINSVLDMELLSDEDYALKWNKFCDDYFENLSRDSPSAIPLSQLGELPNV